MLYAFVFLLHPTLFKPLTHLRLQINSVEFSPDDTVLATGSYDGMTK
jgi:WD40 repeat protein